MIHPTHASEYVAIDHLWQGSFALGNTLPISVLNSFFVSLYIYLSLCGGGKGLVGPRVNLHLLVLAHVDLESARHLCCCCCRQDGTGEDGRRKGKSGKERRGKTRGERWEKNERKLQSRSEGEIVETCDGM